MKQILYILLLLALPLHAVQPDTLRLMSYNIRNGSDMHRQMNLQQQTEIIRQWQPHYVMLQEVDSMCRRSGLIDEARVLADSLGMHATFAHTIDIQGGHYGTALLSREKPLSVQRIPMPNNRENRVLLICEFEDRYVACAHLSYKARHHKKEYNIILKAVRAMQKPFFIGGDWNDTPKSSLLRKLRKHFTILNDRYDLTFPADVPTKCIDYIAVYNGNEAGQGVTKAAFQCVPNEPQASDHRPLIVDVCVTK